MYYQSKLIVSQNSNKSYLLNLLNLNANSREESIINNQDSSIGIKEISSLSEKSSKKSDLIKVILIINSEKLTTEAQNSLLKLIEEPSNNSLILLHTNNIGLIIDTIKSRCEVIFDNKEVEDEEKNNIEFLFKEFTQKDYIQKIKVVEKFLKDYDNKSSYKKAILVILNELAKKQSHLNVVSKIEKAYKAIDLNVSPKLVFDYISIILEA